MTIRMSEEQARRLIKVKIPAAHKYHAQPVTIDGQRFDSKKESVRWGWLRMRERIGEIRELRLQVRFPIHMVNLITGEITDCGAWLADFVYQDVASGAMVVEDVKGFRTAAYRLKKKLVEAQYGITVRER